MKYLLLIAFMTFYSISSFAQIETEDDYIDIDGDQTKKEMETFYKGPATHGFLFGLTAGYAQIEKENTIFLGTKLAYIMNRYFEIGLAGKAFLGEQDNHLFRDNDFNLVGGYGGLHLAPVFFNLEKVHFSTPVLLGVGGVGYTNERLDGFEFAEDGDIMFVIEPGLDLVLNISKYFQFEAGLSYRFTSEIELDNVNNLDLDGIGFNVGFRFGMF